MTKGEFVELAPGIGRLVAPNPGPMTGPGTNTYILGTGPFAVVDPGVDDHAHLAATRAATGDDIAAILLTHRHPDHAGGVAPLARATRAPVRALTVEALGQYDLPVAVDQPLVDGEHLAFGALTLTAIHTPGHAADHLCFHAPASGFLFAGDTVMADVTVVILPPEGSMSAYLASLERLQSFDLAHIAPGHGRLLDNPAEELERIVAHRLMREAEVRVALDDEQPQTPDAIAGSLYPAIDARLRPMAAVQVQAHLIRLAELGEVRCYERGWIRCSHGE